MQRSGGPCELSSRLLIVQHSYVTRTLCAHVCTDPKKWRDAGWGVHDRYKHTPPHTWYRTVALFMSYFVVNLFRINISKFYKNRPSFTGLDVDVLSTVHRLLGYYFLVGIGI